jgi:hypothetical protein
MEIKIKLSNTEHKDLLSYCNLNDLLVSSVVKDSFTTGFNIERYGLLNAGIETKEKEVIKEVIKYVEIPVVEEKEVVKIEYVEVEKRVEVPVDRIIEVIKEIPSPPIEIKVIEYVDREVIKEVIKEVFVSNNDNIYDKPEPEIREVIIEKIVEVIKEVEKIVEVPVEVVKEIVIEKESDGNWKPKLEALQNTVQKLKQDNIEKDRQLKEYEKTIEEIQKFQQDKKAAFLRGSNLNDTLYK